MSTPLVVAEVAAAAAAIWLVQRIMRKSPLPYPPGPPGKPILGNALDIPKTAMSQSHQYAEWARTYGPLIHLNAMGTHLIIVNDYNLAVDLVDKRGATYSDRPHMIMASELIGWNRPLILRRYNDPLFNQIRRCFSQLFGTRQNLEAHSPIFEDEARSLMRRIIAKPDNFEHYIHNCAASIAMRILYGYHPNPEGEDPVLDIGTLAMRQADHVFSTPYLVDIMPWLKYVPSWFPGAGFKKMAEFHRKTVDEMCDLPYRTIMNRIRDGTAEPCFVQYMVEEGDYTPEKEELTKWAATSAYGGGIDTTVSSVSAFFLAMTMFPHILRKAREEIDTVIGRERLPTLADRPRLPYIDAVQREVLRWNPVGPLGIPHSTLEDDVYNGHFVPKGSIVIINLWHILNTPEVYKNPREFNPERFIASPGHPAEPDSHRTAFGFGRRTCPGQNLADATTFLEIALAAAVLDISRARDETGKEIVPDGKFDDGLLMHPLPYPSVIRARDAQAEALLQAAAGH